MVQIGFIGTGGMGRHQAGAFAKVKGVRVAAGADLSPASREAFTKMFPDAKVYEDHQAMLAQEKLDGVVVSVPTVYHQPVVNEVLKLGVPVLCEKPLGLKIDQCRSMIETSKKTGTFLMTAHCRRFDTFWGHMGKLVTTGKLGRPVLWRQMAGGMGPTVPWFNDVKIGGGPMIDGAIHNYDYANFMFGKPVSVIASAIDLTGASAITTATAVVEYENDDQLMVSWSWGLPSTGQGGQDILGSKAVLTITAVNNEVADPKTHKFGYMGVTSCKTQKTVLSKYTKTDMYVNQAKHFISCFQGKTECLSPPEEAIKAVAVAQAIFKSIAGHGKRTKVTW